MGVQENNLTKLCSFYVSDWHFTTMLLPYINKKINEQAKIATILEKDMQQNVEILVKKLNLKNKEKILNINWNKIKEINKSIENIEKNQELIILISGSKEFIERENIKLIRYFETKNIKQSIKIINCYEVIEFNGNIQQILDEHDKILNTSGEKEITDVFTDYKKGNSQEKKAVV